MKGKIKILMLPLVIAVFIFGCAPNGAEFVDELDLVATVRNDTTTYADYQTFAIPDTIIFVSNDEDRELNEVREQEILAEVSASFVSAGWQLESDPETNGADVIIFVTVLDNVNVGFSGWWGWWGGWPGWGWPVWPPVPPGGWYPGFPGWCCYGSVYSWRTGTLLIEMVDPNNPIETPEGTIIPELWLGAINGLLQGSQESLERRTSEGIEQMFIDSPYLIKN